MMSSFNRIPGNRLKILEEKLSLNDEYAMETDAYFKDKKRLKMEAMELEVKNREEEAKRAIEEEKNRTLARLQEEAIRKGYEEGMERARAEAEAEVRSEYEQQFKEAQAVLDEANLYYRQLVEEAEMHKNKFLEGNKEELLEVILLMIRKVIHQTVDEKLIDYAQIFDAVKKEAEGKNKKTFVRLHPRTKRMIEEEYKGAIDPRMEFLVDLELGPLDFIVETEAELIDLRIEKQIENMKKYLRGVLDA